MDKLTPGSAPPRDNGMPSPPRTPALNQGLDAGIGIHGQTGYINDASRLASGANARFNKPPESPDLTPQPSPVPQKVSAFEEGQPGLKTPSRKTSHPIEPQGVHQKEPGGPQSRGKANITSYIDSGRKFPRLSKPVELLRNSYDVVVIGSGYGGGVAASRMARAGKSVCLLERGREKWPGEYPTGIVDASQELHVSGNLAPGITEGKQVDVGDPTGMYHLILGKGQHCVVGNGKLDQRLFFLCQ